MAEGSKNGLRWLLGGVMSWLVNSNDGMAGLFRECRVFFLGGISHASIPAGVSRTTSVSAPDLRGQEFPARGGLQSKRALQAGSGGTSLYRAGVGIHREVCCIIAGGHAVHIDIEGLPK